MFINKWTAQCHTYIPKAHKGVLHWIDRGATLFVVLIAFRNLLCQIINGLSYESKIITKIIRFILCVISKEFSIRFNVFFLLIRVIFAKMVEQQAKLLLHLCVQTRTDCFYDPCLLLIHVFLLCNLQPIVAISLFWASFTKNRPRIFCLKS